MQALLLVLSLNTKSLHSQLNVFHIVKSSAIWALQVLAKQNKEPSRCGYLYKYRPFATGLFSNTWELRFLTLNGSALQYYKSEKDTELHPRGHVDVAVRLQTSPLLLADT